MKIIPVYTRKFYPPQDDVYELFIKDFPPLMDGDVIVISSKVVAIQQGRTIKKADVSDFDLLVQKEADIMLSKKDKIHNLLPLTIKYRTFAPSAGIDESNAADYYILWPEDPFAEAAKLHEQLTRHYRLKRIGIIISDSFLLPMRYGSIGISIAFHGLLPLKDYRGEKDIFDRKLMLTQANIVDSLANTANLYMGEGNEQMPVVILRDIPHLEFTQDYPIDDFFIPKEQDLYYPLLQTTNKEVVQDQEAIQAQDKEQ